MARVAPDGYDVLVYLLNDGPGTHVNTGTLGTAANWTDYGSPISGAQGLFGNALYIAGTPVTASVDGAGGANDLALITTNVSISGWVYIKRYSTSFVELFEKQYRLNAWSAPFLSFGFQMVNTNDGQCDLYITFGGTLQTQLRTPTPYVLPINRWTHIGGTFDGSTMKFYVNGTLVVSGAYSGVIDYNTLGSRGEWFCGGVPGGAVNQTGCAIFNDIRVANTLRSQSYFANIYYNGIAVNG
jgi:Concanavalin A-like lectin/glucanases superfamily